MTEGRLKEIVRRGKSAKITFVHALNDKVIPWVHCERLFWGVVRECLKGRDGGNEESESDGGQIANDEVTKRVERWNLGEGGWLCEFVDGERVIKQRVVKYGGKHFL